MKKQIKKTIKCARCDCLMSWDDQRRQFGRIARRWGPDEAKALMPRCQKCTTVWTSAKIKQELALAKSRQEMSA